MCSDIFDFKLSFLDRKHLAKNIANKLGRFSKFLEKFYENKKPTVFKVGLNHLISCSRFLKVSVSKKSVIVISKPSQIFLIVVMLGFLLWL